MFELTDKQKEDFVEILESKRKESEEIIRENQEILKIINSFSANISVEKQTPFTQPLLTWRKERKLCATLTTDAYNGKDRVMLFTRHAEQTFEDNNVLDKTVGWIIDREAFLSHKPLRNTIAFSLMLLINMRNLKNQKKAVNIAPCLSVCTLRFTLREPSMKTQRSYPKTLSIF